MLIAPFELIIHIGSGKAGSTSIQASLEESKSGLAEQNVFYIGLLGENLAEQKYTWQRSEGWSEFIAKGNESGEQLSSLIISALEELIVKGYKKALWSHEAILNHPEIFLPLFHKVSNLGIKVKVIVYFRRHDAWARSAYMQWGIKHKTYKGSLKSFAEWRKMRKFAYFPKLEPWLKDETIELKVRNFDACEDVVLDFCDLCEIEGSSIQVKRSNQSPSAASLALWALYNGQFDREVLPAELYPVLAKAGILDCNFEDVDFNSLLPQIDDLKSVQEETRLDREKLNALFKASGQPEMATQDIKFQQGELSQNHINAALIMLIKKQNDRISLLEKELAQLLSK